MPQQYCETVWNHKGRYDLCLKMCEEYTSYGCILPTGPLSPALVMEYLPYGNLQAYLLVSVLSTKFGRASAGIISLSNIYS